MTTQQDTKKKMIIDLHVHSSPASPCSSAPIDELIEEAKKIELDGICITDHNYVWDPSDVEDLRQKHGFLILRGNEITTNQGDILVFGMDTDIQGIIKLEELREQVLDAGGIMIAAHPFRGFKVFGVGQLGLSTEQAMERAVFRSVDAIEILNGRVTEAENALSSEVAQGLQIPATGGSDAHEVQEIGVYATQFSNTIHDENSLIEAIKKGTCNAIAYRKQRRKGEI
ncbi:MAG: PHP domain-containing protein [Desulfatiglans sp.]|jgi:predicted metal-dependent phosphoesterase TrpH|nr:PHP domain-containing protein [Thermodesulfobacteriota bacterium]MEE4351668.1 PHP domain-containing protein [Desulfatiglans sp.]